MLKENITALLDLPELGLQQNHFLFQKHSIPIKLQKPVYLFSIYAGMKEGNPPCPVVCVYWSMDQWRTGVTAAVKWSYKGLTRFTLLTHCRLCYCINTEIHLGLIILIACCMLHMKKIVLINLWLCKIKYLQGLTRLGK